MATALQIAPRAQSPIETTDSFAADVLVGLTAKPKRLSPKYFYDAAGSALFERITELPEYYPTRCELAILRDNAPAIASLFPPNCALIEFGSGSSKKARILLGAAATVEAYVPVDISGDFLQQDAALLRRDFPHLGVHPAVADFTQPFAIPASIAVLPRVQKQKESVSPSHKASAALSRANPARVNCFMRSNSNCNCLRPAAVSR